MLGELHANDLVSSSCRRIHHRKSASDTLAFAASALFNELPSPMPHPLGVSSGLAPSANRSTEGGAAENPPSYNLRAGFVPSEFLEVLKDMDEDGLEEFDMDDLCVDDLDVDEDPDVVVCEMGDADAAAPVYPSHTADAEARLGETEAAPAASGNPTAPSALMPLNHQQKQEQQNHLCGGPESQREGSANAPVGHDSGHRRQSTSSMAAGGSATTYRSSHHVRHPSDPLTSPTASLLLEKPLSEFVGQTRANALDPSQLDPKRAKRIIANRQSAHRSRMKKLQVIHDLEEQVTAARAATNASRQEVAVAAARRRELLLAALEAHCQLEGLRRDMATAAAVQATLVSELQSLGVDAVTAVAAAHGQVFPELPDGQVQVVAAAGPCSSGGGTEADMRDAAAAAATATLRGHDGGCRGAASVMRTGLCVSRTTTLGGRPAYGVQRGEQSGAAVITLVAAAPIAAATAVRGALPAGAVTADGTTASGGSLPSTAPSSQVAAANPLSSRHSEPVKLFAPVLVSGLGSGNGAGAAFLESTTQSPTPVKTRCNSNGGGTVEVAMGSPPLLLRSTIRSAVKLEQQQQQQVQLMRDVGVPGLQPPAPEMFFQRMHSNLSSATAPRLPRPAQAASDAFATAGAGAQMPPMQGFPRGSSMAFAPPSLTTPPAAPMDVAAMNFDSDQGQVQDQQHNLLHVPQMLGGPQNHQQQQQQLLPPAARPQQHHRPLHRRHFSAGCATEHRGNPAGLLYGSDSPCKGLLDVAFHWTSTLGTLPCEGSHPTMTTTITTSATDTEMVTVEAEPPPPTTTTTTTITTSMTAAAEEEVVAPGHVPMYMGPATSLHQGLTVLSGRGGGVPAPGAGSCDAGLAAVPVAAAAGDVKGAQAARDGEGGGPASPMAWDRVVESLPDVEDFLVKEEPGSGSGSTGVVVATSHGA